MTGEPCGWTPFGQPFFTTTRTIGSLSSGSAPSACTPRPAARAPRGAPPPPPPSQVVASLRQLVRGNGTPSSARPGVSRFPARVNRDALSARPCPERSSASQGGAGCPPMFPPTRTLGVRRCGAPGAPRGHPGAALDRPRSLEERLVGSMDLVIREEGRVIVLEHKTAARKFTEDQLRYDFQLTAYQLAARESGLGNVGLRFQIITKAKVPAVQIVDVRRDVHDEVDFRRTAGGVLKAIDAGVSYPLRGWQCRTCPYESACSQPARSKGRSAA